MKKLITFLSLLALLIFPKTTNAGYVLVFNGGNTTAQFFVERTGAAPGSGVPTSWSLIPPGNWCVTPYWIGDTADGNFYQVGRTGPEYCHPLAPQAHPLTGNLYFYFYGTNECISVTKQLTARNDTATEQYVVPYLNGEPYPDESYNMYLEPGQSWTRTYSINVCTNGSVDEWEFRVAKNHVEVIENDGGFTFTNITEQEVIGTLGGTNGLNNNDFTTNAVTATYTNAGVVNWSNQTNGFINFSGSGSTNNARDETLRAGFNTLANQLQGIGEKIDKNSAIHLESGTSSGGDTGGLEDAINDFHRNNTNLLSQINAKMSGTNFMGAGSGTNLASAQAAASEQMSGVDGTAAGVLSDLGSAPSLLGGGSPDVLTFEFFGETLNLDPDVRFPGAATFFKSGMMLLVSLWLGRYLVDLYLKTAAIYTASQTGGVPAVGPWGSVGLAIAVVVSVAVVGLWVLVFTAIFTYGLDYLSTVNDTVSGFSTSNAGALYLINLFFPIAFIISAAWTRMVAPFSVAKIVVMTASAQRFLLGK